MLTLSAVLALGLGACGSTPAPTSQIAKVESALQAAELAGARQYAPIELRAAEASKARLDRAMAEEEFEQAARLADEARADAELAKATAEAKKASLALKESQDNIETMVREVGRAQGK